MPRPNQKPHWQPPSRQRGQTVREVTRRHYPTPGRWQPPRPTPPAAPDETAQLHAEVARLQRQLAIMERALAEATPPPPTRRQVAAGYHRNGVTTLVQLGDLHAAPRPGTPEAAAGDSFPASRRFLSDESRAFEVTDIEPPRKIFTRTWAVNDDWRDGRICIMGLNDSPATDSDEELIERVQAFKDSPYAAPPSVEDAQRYATIMAERQTSVFKEYMGWH